MKPAVYNEVDSYCCDVLRARIADGSLPPGDVDGRDIREVSADDYRGYGQIHLFAGIGGFGYAARLAGLPDGFDVLTGGFPCQPWSVAGKHGGASDDRHLWPEMLRLIREIRPRRVLGENVPGLDDTEYMALDGVLCDLEGVSYAAIPVEIPACAVGAWHSRPRLWVIAYDSSKHLEEQAVVEARKRPADESRGASGLAGVRALGWGADQPPMAGVVHGVPDWVDRSKALGNAIVPQVAAEIMRAMRDAA